MSLVTLPSMPFQDTLQGVTLPSYAAKSNLKPGQPGVH